MLNDTRVSDAGVYRCVVNNPPETPDPGIGELELSVVGTWAPPGQLKVSAALPPQEGAGDDTPPPLLLSSALAPPSLPVCQWDGDVSAGGSVTLSCSVAEGTPAPEIRWTKVNPEEVELPINMDGQCPPPLTYRTSSDLNAPLPPPPCPRGSGGLGADRQRVVSDVGPVPLLRHKPVGDGELLRQPVRLQR